SSQPGSRNSWIQLLSHKSLSGKRAVPNKNYKDFFKEMQGMSSVHVSRGNSKKVMSFSPRDTRWKTNLHLRHHTFA
ncbi:MAG: hypothetical protein LBE27_06085, partial [Deltaproteobacteria bacterium]|nr:hypothetical protein [Deltaproteobacteria bacterium]